MRYLREKLIREIYIIFSFISAFKMAWIRS